MNMMMLALSVNVKPKKERWEILILDLQNINSSNVKNKSLLFCFNEWCKMVFVNPCKHLSLLIKIFRWINAKCSRNALMNPGLWGGYKWLNNMNNFKNGCVECIVDLNKLTSFHFKCGQRWPQYNHLTTLNKVLHAVHLWLNFDSSKEIHQVGYNTIYIFFGH